MNVNNVYEYKTNSCDFVQRTRRRIIFELFFLALLGSVFWLIEFNSWLEFFVLIIFFTYILFGIVSYPKAKLIAEKFYICLLDNSLGFPDQEHMRQIPYCDLKILKVIKKGGKIIEIRLKTTFNQTIRLRGLMNMEELYKNIEGRIEPVRRNRKLE